MTVENKEENQTPENAQTNDNPDMVDIHEADIESLDAALLAAQAEEREVEVPSEEVSADASAQPKLEEGKPAESVKADNASAPKADTSKPAKIYTQEEIQAIVAENEKQKKQGDQKELFIQHRGNELGALRAQLATKTRELEEAKARLANGLNERYQEDPAQAANDRDSIKDIDSQLSLIKEQESDATQIVEAQTYFLRNVDMEKVSIDDVADVLKADGIEDRYILGFKANPWKFTTPEALVQMGKRAMDRKELSKATSDRQLLANHVLYLNGEIEKLKGKPRQVMQNVQRNLNASPNVTAASNASPRSAVALNPASVPHMSEGELNAALQAAMRH